MPGGRSSHANKRVRRALNNGMGTGNGGGNSKMGLPPNIGVPIMLKNFQKKRSNK
tara:strand:- start:1282 stop:1446 length:165 start_codon:yes stop_codon:yes gene_type:complete